MTRTIKFCGILLYFSAYASVASATDTGAASAQLYNLPGGPQKLESLETIQRVRIPIVLQAWTTVSTKSRDGTNRESRIPQKPISHILRARIEKPNDFFVGDWRIQTTPIRWLKNTNQYQVRLEVYRRYGEAGQIEESLGTMNLTGILQKQADGLFLVQGSAKKRFNDHNGQPIASLEAGTDNDSATPAPALSRLVTPNTTR